MSETQKLVQELEQYYEKERRADEVSLSFYHKIEDIQNLLHMATFYRDLEAVKYLLSKGASTSVTDDCKNTLLHVLAMENPTLMGDEENIKEIMHLLLEARVSALRKNNQGECAYHLAAKAGNIPFIKVLIERKVKMTMTNEKGNTILHVLAEAAGRNQEYSKHANEEERKKCKDKEELYFQMAKMLVDYELDIDTMNKENKKAYELAAEQDAGRIAIVLRGEYEEEEDSLQLKIATKGKFLHQAIRDKDVEAVKALIALGADVDEVYQESPFFFQTPLAVACMNMQCECVEHLLNAHANPNFRTGEQERSAMYWMIKYCPYPMEDYKEKRLDRVLKALLDAGLDINAPVDEKGNTAIGCACGKRVGAPRDFSYGNFPELFVRTYLLLGADPNLRNKEGKTPLMEFVENTYYERENALLDLLENDADVSLKDNRSETVLMKMARNRNHTVMVQMAELMSDFGALDISAVNDNGKSALDIAAENNNEELTKWILERM